MRTREPANGSASSHRGFVLPKTSPRRCPSFWHSNQEQHEERGQNETHRSKMRHTEGPWDHELDGHLPSPSALPLLHCMLFLYLWDIREAHLSMVLLLQQPKRTKVLLQQPQQTMTPWSIVPSLNHLWSPGDVLVISFSDLVSHSQPHQGHLSYVPLSTPRYLSSHS